MAADPEDLHPEQQRALDYLRGKGTEAPVERLREQVAATFADIEALLESVPAELRATRPGPDRWSVQEVVDHLIESHRPAVEQLRALVAGQRPAGGPIPAHLQSAAPLARPWEELVAELHRVHRDYRAALDEATESTPLGVTAPMLMVIKVSGDGGALTPITWERELDWKALAQAFRVHTIQHRQQIQATLGALGHPPSA